MANDGGEGNGGDQPSKAELQQRVEQLENTVQKMLPTRRDAIKMGATAVAAGGLGAAGGVSHASAQTQAAGQLGTEADPVDVEGASVNSELFNQTWWLDPDANDFGAAVNDIIDDMGFNDVLKIPPVDYDCDTTALIDKNIAIIGDAGEGIGGHYQNPRIQKTSDVPIFETSDDDLSMRFSGLRLEGEGMDSNDEPIGSEPLIVARDRVLIDWIGMQANGGHGMHLAESNHNHNFSTIQNVGAKDLGGDLVRVSEDSFGIGIDIRAAMECDWVVNIDDPDANGITAHVQTVVNCSEGGVRLGGVGNSAKIEHMRTTNIGVQFESSPHFGQVVHIDGGLEDPFVDNSSNPQDNTKIYPDAGDWMLPGLGVAGPIIHSNIDTSTLENLQNADADSTHHAERNVRYTDGVGDTATTIWGRSDVEERRGARVTVFGREGGLDYFIESVLYTAAGSADVVSSSSRGSNTGRTYSVDAGDLQLAMDSSTTVNVAATGWYLGAPEP